MFLPAYVTHNIDSGPSSVGPAGKDDKRLPNLTAGGIAWASTAIYLVESHPISLTLLLCINDDKDPATPVANGTVSGSMRLINRSLWPSCNSSIKSTA